MRTTLNASRRNVPGYLQQGGHKLAGFVFLGLVAFITAHAAAKPTPSSLVSQLRSPMAEPSTERLANFTRHSLAELEQRYHGQPWLLLMWSVDCPPCYQELQAVGELMAQYDATLPVALVSTDPQQAGEDVQQTLTRFNLGTVDSWHFAVEDGRALRYAIDSQWFGELPRAYLYDGNGRRQAHSGVISIQLIREHLCLNENLSGCFR